MLDAKTFKLSDIKKDARIYFIGIGGISMNGLARLAKHAGFVVNNGGATSKQVIQLMSIVKQSCKKTFGITLEPEVVFLGSTDDFRRLSYTHGF